MRASFVCAVAMMLLWANWAHADPARFEAAIAKFEEADRQALPKPGGILFIGSSSVRLWDTDKSFPGMGVLNRGFGGSQIEDSIFFADRIVIPYKPRVIVMYAGDNDINAGKDAQRVFEDYKAFVAKVHASLPKARIVFIAIKPSIRRWQLVETVRAANALIREHTHGDPRLFFADIDPPMIGADGQPRPELFVADGLHLSEAGYELWNDIVRPYLVKRDGPRQELWITNAYGDDVHVYQVGTWKLIHRFKVGANPHGISATADGRTVHIALEKFQQPAGEVLFIDAKTFEVTGRVEVGPKPNEIECTPDGRFIYVPCEDEQYWIIDGESKQVVKKIKTGGRPHNTTIGPDGRYMYLSPMGLAMQGYNLHARRGDLAARAGGKGGGGGQGTGGGSGQGRTKVGPQAVWIVDTQSDHRVVGRIQYANHPRPPAISPDGRLFFANIDGLSGFQVADIESRSVINTIEHEMEPALRDIPSRCHGLAMRPDGREIWCCDVERHLVHIHEASSGEYKQVAALPMIGRIYWITFTPDSRYCFVSVRSEGKVAVVNSDSKRILTYLEAGDTPKRTQVIRVARP